MHARRAIAAIWPANGCAKRDQEIFGWSKDGRPLRKMRVVGFGNAAFMATLTIGATACCASQAACDPGTHVGDVSMQLENPENRGTQAVAD